MIGKRSVIPRLRHRLFDLNGRQQAGLQELRQLAFEGLQFVPGGSTSGEPRQLRLSPHSLRWGLIASLFILNDAQR